MRPLRLAMAANTARLNEFVAEARRITALNDQTEERYREFNRQYDEQRDAVLASAAIQPPEVVQADVADPAEESEESDASYFDSSSSHSD